MGAAAEILKPTKPMTVKDAIRQASRKAKLSVVKPEGMHSHWLAEVIPLKGRKKKGVWVHNLTTDTATGYTNRRDWQSKAMGEGPSFAFATATGTSTAVGATSLTNTGASFTTAGQGLAGKIVVSGSRYGVILSNTATVLTIDQWYDPASTSGAAGSTPSTGVYVILPGQAPAPWIALSSDGTAPTAADTTLTSELTTNGFARGVGTYAHTAAATTYTLQRLFTAAGTATINTMGVFGSATSATGVMPFKAAVPSPPTLVSGDTLTVTVTVTIN
jgi:hypothetical protein